MIEATFKITDFNISTFTSTGYDSAQTGTPYYASPEMLLKKLYSYNNDIWSLGVTFYEFITLELPFKAETIDQMIVAHQNTNVKQIPSIYSKDLSKIIFKMLTYGHSCRPFTDNLLEDPVVTRKIKEIFGDETKMEEVRIEKIDGNNISKK